MGRQNTCFDALLSKGSYMNKYISETLHRKLLKPLGFCEKHIGKLLSEIRYRNEPVTRKEAITAIAGVFADIGDIADAFTSDFDDINAADVFFPYIAFMERCEFLPYSGSLLEPEIKVTRAEFAEMLTGSSDNVQPDGCSEITWSEAVAMISAYVEKTYGTDYLPKVREIRYSVKPGDCIQTVIDSAQSAAETVPMKSVIELEAGEYRLSSPLKVRRSACSGSELVFSGSGKTVLSGCVDIPTAAFKKVDGKNYYMYSFGDNLRCNGKFPEFRDLYLNGQRLKMASDRERKFEKSLRNSDPSKGYWTYDNWFYIAPECVSKISDDHISPMELCINVEWMNKRFRIAEYHGIDLESGLAQVSVCCEEWNAFIGWDGNKRDFLGKVYWVENHLSLLDEPGEFFYDRENGTVYFYPFKDTDMEHSVISYPMTDSLIKLDAAENVTVEGITFTGTTSSFVSHHGYDGGLGGIYLGVTEESGDRGHIPSAAILGSDTRNTVIKNCTFNNLGSHGIYLDHGNINTVIRNNSFTELSMAGIIVGRQYPDWTEEHGLTNIIIGNNYIFNIGTDYPLSPGIQVTRVMNLSVTHNTVLHTPYCGIMSGWFKFPENVMNSRNVEIQYNYCDDNMYAINDGAGIYVPGANAPVENTDIFMRCHHNYLKATGYNGTYNGIYLDANASNWLVSYNVVDGFNTKMGPIFNQGWGVPSQTTYNNVLLNNYSTLREIEVLPAHDGSIPVDSRNLSLIGNKFYLSSSELPNEAVTIKNKAGCCAELYRSVPTAENEISVTTSDSCIVPGRENDGMIVEIANNSASKATYAIEAANDISHAAIMKTSGELTLMPGERGNITVTFEPIPNAEMTVADFTILRDNGWKRNYRRAIRLMPENQG